MYGTPIPIPSPKVTALPSMILTLHLLYSYQRSKKLFWKSAQFYQEEDDQ